MRDNTGLKSPSRSAISGTVIAVLLGLSAPACPAIAAGAPAQVPSQARSAAGHAPATATSVTNRAKPIKSGISTAPKKANADAPQVLSARASVAFVGPSPRITGGTLPYAFTLDSSSDALPTGLTLNRTTGIISGVVATSTSSASYNIVVKATDRKLVEVTKAYTLNVAASPASRLSVSTLTLPMGSTANLAAVGGYDAKGRVQTRGYAFALDSGVTLPDGVTLSPLGVLAVSSDKTVVTDPTPSTSYGITVTDGSGTVTTLSLRLAVTVPTLAISDSTVTATAAYTGPTPRISGGNAPYTFSLGSSSDALPTGLTLNTRTGVVSGIIATGATADTKSITIDATDKKGVVASKTYTLTVAPAPSSRLATTNLSVVTGTSTPLVAMGGYDAKGKPQTKGYTFALASSSTLPSGVTLSTAGVIAVDKTTVTAAIDSAAYDIEIKDGANTVTTVTLNLGVTVPTITIAESTATASAAYAGPTPVVAGGTAPYSFSIDAGGSALPTGLTINRSTGVVSGVLPKAASDATPTWTVKVTDKNGLTATAAYSLPVMSSPDATLAVSDFVLVTGGAAVLSASGGYDAKGLPQTLGYKYAVDSGTPLPSGVTLSSAGILRVARATVTAAIDPADYTITITDGSGQVTTTSINLEVTVPTIEIEDLDATASVAYTGPTPLVGGGTAPYTFSIDAGGNALPSGLTINAATGVVSGILPTSEDAATYTYSVIVTDKNGLTAKANYTLEAAASPKSVLAATSYSLLPGASTTLVATGGYDAQGKPQTTGYTFALASGITLPDGVDLSPSGVLSVDGAVVKDAIPSDDYDIVITDKSGTQTTIKVLIEVTYPSITIDPSSATASVAYTGPTPVVTGGTGPYTFSIDPSGDPLPHGLSISATTGVVSGVLDSSATAQTHDFKVMVTDRNGLTKSVEYSLQAAASPSATLTTTNLSIGAGASVSLAATGGYTAQGLPQTTGYKYDLASGVTLPAGVTLSQGGVISTDSGTVTATIDSAVYDIVVTDGSGTITPASITLEVTVPTAS